jgi:hypothetical protein
MRLLAILQYLPTLALTLLVEPPVVVLLYRTSCLRSYLVSIIANLLTHSTMHFVLAEHVQSYSSFLLIGESGSLIFEAIIYWHFLRPKELDRAFFASSIANLGSYLVSYVFIR